MEIDFEKALIVFKDYLKDYDLNNGSINLKIKHTYEVVKLSTKIAESLKLTKEDITIAKIIALLHDIGRFTEIKEFQGFEGLEHAAYGVELLFKKGLIRKFISSTKYDNIIKKAIYNHNKYKIEDGLNEKELLHSKIIRDADKTSNFRVNLEEDIKDSFPDVYNEKTINYESISPKVYKDFLNHKCILLADRKTMIDYWVCALAFIYDLNFKISLDLIKKGNYINLLIDKIDYKNKDTKQKMENIRKCALEYLNK